MMWNQRAKGDSLTNPSRSKGEMADHDCITAFNRSSSEVSLTHSRIDCQRVTAPRIMG